MIFTRKHSDAGEKLTSKFWPLHTVTGGRDIGRTDSKPWGGRLRQLLAHPA